MARFLVLILLPFYMAGCVSQASIENDMRDVFNVQSSGISQFDDIEFIRISNMICSNFIIMELYQDSPKAEMSIVLLNAGSKSVENIGNGQSLHIKLDGKQYSFESEDTITEHDRIHYGYGVTSPFSHKSYFIPEQVVREAAAANEFIVKIELLNKTYIEGKCSPLSLQEAREGSNNLGINMKQKNVDSLNKFSATYGFRSFVHMMDSTMR